MWFRDQIPIDNESNCRSAMKNHIIWHLLIAHDLAFLWVCVRKFHFHPISLLLGTSKRLEGTNLCFRGAPDCAEWRQSDPTLVPKTSNSLPQLRPMITGHIPLPKWSANVAQMSSNISQMSAGWYRFGIVWPIPPPE